MNKFFISLILLLILTTLIFAVRGIYTILKPNGEIDPIRLSMAIDNLYSKFPVKFDKFNTVPAMFNIGEQQIVLYKEGNTARLYTIMDDTTWYVSLVRQ